MKHWTSFASLLGAYNYYSKSDSVHDPDYEIKIEENISPLTDVFLNLFSNLISKKNLIVTFPDNILRPIPILTYIFSENFKRSSLVFTSNHKGFNNVSINDFHNQNYCMLARDTRFITYNILIGNLSKNKVQFNIKFPKSSNKRRTKKIVSNLIKVLDLSKPIVLLCTDDDLEIVDSISEIEFDSKSNVFDENFLDVGLVIFENVDLYINSKYTYENFIKWIKKYEDKNIHFLFHFSNPTSKFIDLIKKETDSFVIPFNVNLISKSYLFGKSNEYNSNYLTDYPKRKDIIKNYNLDSSNYFNESFLEYKGEHLNIIQPLLKIGNFEDYFNFAKNILKGIDNKKVINQRMFRLSKKLFYSLLSLTVNPLRFKIKYGYGENWRYYSIIHFLELFKKSLSYEDDAHTKQSLGDYIDCLISMVFDLGKTKHYGEQDSFDRVGKEYLVLDIANNPETYFQNDKKLIIACYNSVEVSILEEELRRLNINNVVVKNIYWLNKSLLSNKEEYNLLLPGIVPLKHISELLMPYAKILILSYEGINFKNISKQIEDIDTLKQLDELRLINYFSEIYEYLDISDDAFLNSIINIGGPNNFKLVDKSDEKDYIANLANNIFKSSDYVDSKISEKLSQEIAEDELSYEVDSPPSETLNFTLKNLESGDVVNKKLPLDKSFNYLNKSNKLMEGSPKTIKKGDFLIFIDNNDKKTLLELIIEVYDLELAVDKNIIEFWKNKLMHYVTINNLKYVDFNREFKAMGGNKTVPATSMWVKGETIGPNSAHDLYLIGKVIDNSTIMENYEYMFEEIEKIRVIHRVTGRRLNNLVKQIMGSKTNLNVDNLGYTSQLFYDKIRYGIYEVLEKS